VHEKADLPVLLNQQVLHAHGLQGRFPRQEGVEQTVISVNGEEVWAEIALGPPDSWLFSVNEVNLRILDCCAVLIFLPQ